MSNLSTASAGGKGGNFLNQLESMLGAVKKEAGALESMKAKLKDMEEVKHRLHEFKTKLAARDSENTELRQALNESEQQRAEMRSDMQRLNDIYNTDRGKMVELQQAKSRLEQELSGLKLEKDFFLKESQKIPELKKNNKTLKTQLVTAKKAAEDEAATKDTKILELGKEVESLTKAKDEASQHFWNVTKEFNSAKETIEEERAQQQLLKAQLEEAGVVRAQLTDRLFMTREDFKAVRVRKYEMGIEHRRALQQHQGELQTLQFSLNNKKDELQMVQADLDNLQQRHETDTATKNARLVALEESVRDLTVKNQALAKESSALKQRMASSGSDGERMQQQLQEAKQQLSAANAQLAQREADSAAAVKGLTLQRDDLQYKLQSVTAQLEGLQAGAKAEQAKHWEEVKRLKEAESNLLEEADRLTQELQEKTVQLHAVESAKASVESNMREEVSETAQLSKSLQVELERRLEELVQMRNERDALALGRDEFVSTIDALKADAAKKEEAFRKAMETDRQQVKQELQSRSNRIRALEAEKHELLSETQGLMAQVGESQQETAALRKEAEQAKAEARSSGEQLDIVRAHNNDLVRELQAAARQEEELKSAQYKAEGQWKEEQERHEVALREAKKAASHQVLQLNDQIRSLCEEVEALKRNEHELLDKERKASTELDRVRTELRAELRSHQEQQQQVEDDLANARRELQEQRGRAKIVLEGKTKLEMELISTRAELSRAETEAGRQAEAVKAVEEKLRGSEEKLRASQAAVESMTASTEQFKGTVAELEEAVQRKNGAIDALKEDMVQLERDGLIEVRRLRMQLSSSEQEVNELRPMIPMLQKEVADGKATIAKLQNSTNGTVNNLLEEVRVAEDALSQERKRNQAEQHMLQARLTEVQMNNERLREALEEAQQRAKAERSERELKAMQGESDLERLKGSLAGKDARIEELERQHHGDRVRMHEWKDKVDAAERDVASVRSQLEHEQAHRQRVEARLRSMLSTPDYASAAAGGPGVAAAAATGDRDDVSLTSGSELVYHGAGSGYHSARSARSTSARPPNHSSQQQIQGQGQGEGSINEHNEEIDYYDGGSSATEYGGGSNSGGATASTRSARWMGGGGGGGGGGGDGDDASSSSSLFSGRSRPYSARTQQLLAAAGNADPYLLHQNQPPSVAVLPSLGSGRTGSGGGGGGRSMAHSNNSKRLSTGSSDDNDTAGRPSLSRGQLQQHQQHHHGDYVDDSEDVMAVSARSVSALRQSQSHQPVPTLQGLQQQQFLSPGRKTPRSLSLPLDGTISGNSSTSTAQHGQYGQQAPLQYPQSPVVDRVSQALAARAAAESSKIALRQAQQHRAAAGGRHGSVHHNISNNNSNSNSNNNSFDKGRDEEDAGGNSAIEESIQRTQAILNRKMQQQRASEAQGNGQGHGSATYGYGNSGSGGNSGIGGDPDSGSKTETSARSPNSGRSTGGGGGGSLKIQALSESIQQARSLYPASPSPSSKASRDWGPDTGPEGGPGGDRDGLDPPTFNLGAPELQPARPPAQTSKNLPLQSLTAAASAAMDDYNSTAAAGTAGAGRAGGAKAVMEEEDDMWGREVVETETLDDEDPEPVAAVGAGAVSSGGNSGRGKLTKKLSGGTLTKKKNGAAAAVSGTGATRKAQGTGTGTGGGGAGGGGGGAGGPNYNGLEEALSLPKIGASGPAHGSGRSKR